MESEPRDLLHYEIQGKIDAPWLVFVHGAGGSIKTWKFQIDDLAKDFRLLLIDLVITVFQKTFSLPSIRMILISSEMM